jgi:hypothetical protein
MAINSSSVVGWIALAIALLAMGCGSDGSTEPGGNESSTTGRLGPEGLAEPKFVFSPRDPGRAVGIRGIVTVDGRELTTEPIELRLLASEGSTGVRKSASALTRKSANSAARCGVSVSHSACSGTASDTAFSPSLGRDPCAVSNLTAASALLLVASSGSSRRP